MQTPRMKVPMVPFVKPVEKSEECRRIRHILQPCGYDIAYFSEDCVDFYKLKEVELVGLHKYVPLHSSYRWSRKDFFVFFEVIKKLHDKDKELNSMIVASLGVSK